MLSIYTLKSAAKAGTYYQEDNYYAKQGEEPCGVWFGKGAAMLGLENRAKLGDFIAKLEGNLSQEIKMVATTKNHRPGYDLTFSAPKSVSILAIVGRDERVLNAHRDAVNETLAYLEKHYAKTRVKIEGKTTIQSTDNLLVTKFEHTDSRALDPNLHTHCIVMNATRRADEKWRTLYFDEVYNDKMLLGVIYRGHLAQKLMKAGFEITQTSEKGLFELTAFPENLIKQLSKRREQITQELEKRGLDGGSAAQIANFATREGKKTVDPERLELAWTVELNRCGYNLEWLKNYSKEAIARGEVTPPDPYQLAHKAVLKAAQDLGDWRGVFTSRDLIKTASGLSISNYSPILIDKRINYCIVWKYWDDILRFMATIKTKTTTASQLFKRLNSYAKDHYLYRALREFGRIIKSIFILNYISDVNLRQQIEKQLNKIELSNKFSRAVFFSNNQEFSDGSKEEQILIAICKSFIQNCIILWNYLYLSQLLINKKTLEEKEQLLKIIKANSVISWRHVNLQGEYDFTNVTTNHFQAKHFDMEKILKFKVA